MLDLDIIAPVDEFMRWADDVERRQVPFALSNAINSTLFDVRRELVEKEFPRAFEVRNKRFIGTALRVDKATKKTLEGKVFDRLGRKFLALQAKGGIKYPIGNHVAIPTKAMMARRTGRGIPRNMRPRHLMQSGRGFVTTVNGQKMIFRKYGRGKVEPAYVLEKNAAIQKRFRAYEAAERVVTTRLFKHFDRAFERAMATARR